MGQVFRITTWILLALSSIWTISFFWVNFCKTQSSSFLIFLTGLVHCSPIQANWVSHYSGKVVCIPGVKFFWAQVISDVILDGLWGTRLMGCQLLTNVV